MEPEIKNESGTWIKWVMGIVVIAVIVWLAVSWNKTSPNSAPAKETGPIKIGFIGPLTGDGATIGQNAKEATALAVEEVNAAGGVNGRQIEVIYEDGKCNGKDAANAASKLINVDKVTLILGGGCSGETLSFTTLAENSKTPVLSYCSSVPTLTTAGDYIFRDVPSDAYQGAYAANYIFSTLQKKKVAVLYQQTEWSSGIKDVFITEFKKLGGEIVLDEGFAKDARDFRTPLAKVKTAKPDLIYFVSYAEPAIPALQQVRSMGIKAPLFGADAWSDPKIPKEAGADAEGIMFTGLASHTNQAFVDKMKQKTGTDTISECSAPAYDGMKIIAGVLKEAGTDRAKIKDGLYQVDYRGGAAYDEIKFDANGDMLGAQYSVKKIVNSVGVELK